MGRDLRRIFCRVLRIHIAMSCIARLRYQIELCLAYPVSLSELERNDSNYHLVEQVFKSQFSVTTSPGDKL